MNVFFKYGPLFFSILVLVVLFILIRAMVLSPFYRDRNISRSEERGSHYAFFLPASDHSFFRQIKDGAKHASNSLDCTISFYPIDKDTLSLKMVPYLGIDGICLYPFMQNDDLISTMKSIRESGIPIIQLENEIVREENTFYIGTNHFETGLAVGKLALLADKDLINIAIVYSDKNPGLQSGSSLVEMGIKSIIGDSIGNLYTRNTNLNPLDAERLAYEIVKESPEIDLIVLSDPNDTLVAVQAIIDNNLVGRVQIIGFGEDKHILEYIDKGIILGTIVRNPYRIGFSAVLALQEIELNGYTSAYVDTGIKIITQKTLKNRNSYEPN